MFVFDASSDVRYAEASGVDVPSHPYHPWLEACARLRELKEGPREGRVMSAVEDET